MEEKINIAEILKDKPVGLKLYSSTFGCIRFNGVYKDKVYFYSEDTNAHSVNQYGKMYDGGECIIFPSKEMRDWSKFAWKPGDVLVNKDGDVHIIFDGFEDDTYKNFHGKNYLWEEGGSIVNFEEDEDYMQTSDFNKANKEDAQEYIHKIEKELGCKLNLETLEIEKARPEFKDGDIITFKDRIIIIYNTSIEKSPIRTEIYYHACLKGGELTVNEYLMSCGFGEGWYSSTEEEKHQLFDALAKEGKQWDSEKKMIVGLKPKVEFKPFDKVLCRNSKYDTWEADFFARLTRKEIDYTQSGKYLCVGDLWMYCIPYNEETAHLLGTTDDWEGGEQ